MNSLSACRLEEPDIESLAWVISGICALLSLPDIDFNPLSPSFSALLRLNVVLDAPGGDFYLRCSPSHSECIAHRCACWCERAARDALAVLSARRPDPEGGVRGSHITLARPRWRLHLPTRVPRAEPALNYMGNVAPDSVLAATLTRELFKGQ